MCGIDQVLYQIDHAQVVIILQCISLNENGKKIDDKVKSIEVAIHYAIFQFHIFS